MNFGLINRTYPTDAAGDEEKEKHWTRFERYVRSLDATKKENERFKVLFLGRHGQGWHNVAESKYGTKAWDVRFLLQLRSLCPKGKGIMFPTNKTPPSATGPLLTAQTA